MIEEAELARQFAAWRKPGRQRSVYKMHIHRWAKTVEMNASSVMLAQAAAVHAPMVYELMCFLRPQRMERLLRAVRPPGWAGLHGKLEGGMDDLLPGRPPAAEWLALYGEHRRITQALGDNLGELVGIGPDLQELADMVRAVGRLGREEPEKLRAELERMGRTKLKRIVLFGLRTLDRIYRAHLKSMRKHLQQELDDDGGDFDAAIRRSPEVHFYMRVVLPCLCLYQTLPAQLLRRASRADPRRPQLQAQAIERWVRLDRAAIYHPAVERWWNADGGNVSRQREQQLRVWAEQGLDYGQFSLAQVKKILAGLIWALTEKAGAYWNWTRRRLEPARITAEDIRRLFHAVENDRRPGEGGKLSDPDIADIQGATWRREISRFRRLWRMGLWPKSEA